MIIDHKNLTLLFRCKMRHSKKEDFKIIKCKLTNTLNIASSDNLYFASKILKEWKELKVRWPTLDKIKIEYNTVGQNLLYLYEKDNDKHLAIGFMTLVGVQTND
jgi:hypothetical protein